MDSLSTIKITDKSFPNAAESAVEDVEISIFDAEKYFNEESNDLKRAVEKKKKPDQSHDPFSSPAEFRAEKSVRVATSSEASWNSQTALLTTTAAARHRARKAWFAAKKWFLRRRRCCCDGESIRVKEVIGSDSVHIRPIVVMDSVKSSCNRNSKTVHAADHSYERDDVVEIHRIRAAEAAPGQQRILATGRPFINATVGFTFPILSSVAAAAKDDDVGSDASSDLFEIEAFSTQTASPCPIQSLCDSVDGNSNGDRKSVPANGLHRSRLSVSAGECRPSGGESEESVVALRPLPEEAEGGEGRRKSDGGATSMSCREGPPLIPLGACERPGPGSSRSPPLVAAA